MATNFIPRGLHGESLLDKKGAVACAPPCSRTTGERWGGFFGSAILGDDVARAGPHAAATLRKAEYMLLGTIC